MISWAPLLLPSHSEAACGPHHSSCTGDDKAWFPLKHGGSIYAEAAELRSTDSCLLVVGQLFRSLVLLPSPDSDQGPGCAGWAVIGNRSKIPPRPPLAPLSRAKYAEHKQILYIPNTWTPQKGQTEMNSVTRVFLLTFISTTKISKGDILCWVMTVSAKFKGLWLAGAMCASTLLHVSKHMWNINTIESNLEMTGIGMALF